MGIPVPRKTMFILQWSSAGVTTIHTPLQVRLWSRYMQMVRMVWWNVQFENKNVSVMFGSRPFYCIAAAIELFYFDDSITNNLHLNQSRF